MGLKVLTNKRLMKFIALNDQLLINNRVIQPWLRLVRVAYILLRFWRSLWWQFRYRSYW